MIILIAVSIIRFSDLDRFRNTGSGPYSTGGRLERVASSGPSSDFAQYIP
jgi:hypothetical protein